MVSNLSLTNSKQAISEKIGKVMIDLLFFFFFPPSLFDYFEVSGFFWSNECGKLSKYRGSTAMESFAVPIILL